MLRPAQVGDLPRVVGLLADAGLPADGLREHLSCLLVAVESRSGAEAERRDLCGADAVVGSAGLELYGPVALLRSVVVSPDRRGQGLGAELVGAALALGRERGVARVYLLTETAQTYFARLGFRSVERDSVAGDVRTSVEFTSACPVSATAMLMEIAAPSPPA